MIFLKAVTLSISPVTAGWILSLPLLDASDVIGRRISSGKPPIKPGSDHLHYFLIDAGFSVNQTVGILVFVHSLMVLFSVSAKIFIGQSADLILFWLFIVLVLVKILFA